MPRFAASGTLVIGGPSYTFGDPRTLDLEIVPTTSNGGCTYEQNLTDSEMNTQVEFVWHSSIERFALAGSRRT